MIIVNKYLNYCRDGNIVVYLLSLVLMIVGHATVGIAILPFNFIITIIVALKLSNCDHRQMHHIHHNIY